MKSLTQIHQQALNLLGRVATEGRPSTRRLDTIARIHNRYLDNACRIFGATDSSVLSRQQWDRLLPRRQYAVTPEATNRHPFNTPTL